MNQKEELYRIAKSTRRWLLYQINGNIVSGWCAIATAKLFQNLNSKNAVPVVIDANWIAHCYVQYSTPEGDLIIDITADQFDGEKAITIKPVNSKDLKWYHSGIDPSFSKIKKKIGLELFVKETRKWGNQSPIEYGIKLNER